MRRSQTIDNVKIGMASWHDRLEIFPPGCTTTEDRLKHYSSIYPTVEADTSFYGIRPPKDTARWASWVLEGFLFHVKAFRLFTGHFTPAKNLPRLVRERLAPEHQNRNDLRYKDLTGTSSEMVWEAFDQMLEPLYEASKLGLVIFQLPPAVGFHKGTQEHLVRCRQRLSKYQVAVEFRNASWFDGRAWAKTQEFLQQADLGYIAVDGPQGLRTSVPPYVFPRGGISLVRFHGRNEDGWTSRGPNAKNERLNYRYTDYDFREWIPRIEEMAHRSDEVHLIMNTNQGPSNGAMLARILSEESSLTGNRATV